MYTDGACRSEAPMEERVVIKIQGSQRAECGSTAVQHLFLGIKIIRVVLDSLGQPVLFLVARRDGCCCGVGDFVFRATGLGRQ